MIKICGVRAEADALGCERGGASMVGVNLVPGVRRAVDEATARALVRLLRAGRCEPVLVLRDEPASRVAAACEALGARWAQLHGAEGPEACAALRARGLRVLKALSFDGDGPALAERARRYAGAVDALLIDAPSPGSGRTLPWRALGALPLPRPFVLAGGLTPDNVAEAVAAARPDGVDVASGIEQDGRPSAAKIAAFVREASRALAAVEARFEPGRGEIV